MLVLTWIPVVAIVLRLSDREVGENNALLPARLRFEELNVGARRRLVDIKPCVEHDHVAVGGSDRRHQRASIGEAPRVEEREDVAGGRERQDA
jgi:hypothetical protein